MKKQLFKFGLTAIVSLAALKAYSGPGSTGGGLVYECNKNVYLVDTYDVKSNKPMKIVEELNEIKNQNEMLSVISAISKISNIKLGIFLDEELVKVSNTDQWQRATNLPILPDTGQVANVPGCQIKSVINQSLDQNQNSIIKVDIDLYGRLTTAEQSLLKVHEAFIRGKLLAEDSGTNETVRGNVKTIGFESTSSRLFLKMLADQYEIAKFLPKGTEIEVLKPIWIYEKMGYRVDPRNNAKSDSHLLLFEGFMSNCTLAIKKGKEPFVRPGRFQITEVVQVDTSRQVPTGFSSASPFGIKKNKNKKDEVVFHLQSLEETVNPDASKIVSIYCSSDRSRGYWYDIDNSQKYVGEHFQKKTFTYFPEHLSVADIKRTLRNYFSIKTAAEKEIQTISNEKTSNLAYLKDNSNLFNKQCSIKQATDLDLKDISLEQLQNMIDTGSELCVEHNQLHIKVQNNWLKINGQFFGLTGPATNEFYNMWNKQTLMPALQYIVLNKTELFQKSNLKEILAQRGLVLNLKVGEAGRISQDLKQLQIITEHDQVLTVNFSGTYDNSSGPSFTGLLNKVSDFDSYFSIYGYKIINNDNVVSFLLSADTYISTKIEVSIEIFNNKELDLIYEAGDANYSLTYVYLGKENRIYTRDDENLTLRKRLKVSAKDITPNFKTIKVKYSGNN